MENKMDEWKKEFKQDVPEPEDITLPDSSDGFVPALHTPVDKSKAQAYIKKQIENAELHDLAVGLPVGGRSEPLPEDTLAGAIVSSRYGEEIHEKVKYFRVKIDSLYLTARAITEHKKGFMLYGGRSREVKLSVTAFQNSRQWCGKILQERGSATPYSKDNTDRADQGEVIKNVMTCVDEVCALQSLREEAEDVITEVIVFCELTPSVSLLENLSRDKVLAGLIDGKMWLGERLGFLRQHHK